MKRPKETKIKGILMDNKQCTMDNQKKTILIGSYATTYDFQDYSVDTVVRCESVSINTYENSLTIAPALNPSTGCQHNSFQDCLSHTTAFERDEFYDDESRYSLTQSTIKDFSQIYPDNRLMGVSFVIACTAYNLDCLGYNISVALKPGEVTLREFCRRQGWRVLEIA